MLDLQAHAAPGMKRSVAAPAAACSEPAPAPGAEPQRHATTSDLLAPFAPMAPPAPPLQAVYMKGYGRLALYPHALGAGASVAPAAPAAPAVPDELPQERSERLRLVAHWLDADDDLDDDDPHSAGARAAAIPTYHPMVAKGLREQSRRAVRRSPRTPRHDWWIASDGTRQPRGAPATTSRRRMVSTMHALAASGIAPLMACRCGFTDDHMDMMQCDGCARWLHLACAGVSHVNQLPDADCFCDDCYDQRTAMAQPRAASTANDTGLHAHALQRSSTLSLAPSPKRSLEDRPFLPEHAASPARVSASSDDGTRALWRTPSPPPPPSLQLVGTPSRHFTPFAHAEWLPTPTHFLAHTPYSGIRTPSRPLGPLDSPTAATRRAQYLATPSQASPVHSDPVPSSVALSSPMPVTPTGPTRSRLLAMPLGSPATPKTAPVGQMPLAWAWD